MREKAFKWFNTYLRNYLENIKKLENIKDKIKDIFQLWDKFKLYLTKMFEKINEKKTVKRVLDEMIQIKSTSAYVSTFQQNALKTKWEDETLMTRYYRELKDRVKNVMIIKEKSDEL